VHLNNTFAMVVNFINNYWQPFHVIVGVFEVQNIDCVAMANQVNVLIDSFGSLNKVIAYVKDKSSNLNTLTNVLKFMVFYFPLQLPPFVKLCFSHAMSKVA
jgi:hypothetical protein